MSGVPAHARQVRTPPRRARRLRRCRRFGAAATAVMTLLAALAGLAAASVGRAPLLPGMRRWVAAASGQNGWLWPQRPLAHGPPAGGAAGVAPIPALVAPAPTDGPRAGPARLSQWPWRHGPAPADAARYGAALTTLAAWLPAPSVSGALGLRLPPGTPMPLRPPAGRSWLPSHRIVAYYGNPLATGMGVLGAYAPDVVIARLRAQAAAYAALDPAHPVIPALELVADVGQGTPGADGLYRLRMTPELVARELALARRARALLILDLQVGRSTLPAEVPSFAAFLVQPDVELALDPEFDMPPGEVPGMSIGSMSASEINWAVDYLAALVAHRHLPDKLLVVHQFTPGMVPDWRHIRPAPGVQFVMDTDGFGSGALKQANYLRYITDQPIRPVRYGGIKLFYRYDTGLMPPATVLALRPAPSLVIYQ